MFTVSPRRLVTGVAAVAVVAATLVVAPPAAPARAQEVTLSAEEVDEALFVAGDIARVSADPAAGVLEGVLQELYAVRPDLSADAAVGQIRVLESALAGSTPPARGRASIAAQSAGAATYEYCQGWREPAQGVEWTKRDHICADWHHTNAARLHFLTAAIAEAEVLPATKRAVRKQVKATLAASDNGIGASVLTPTLDQATGSGSMQDASVRLQHSYALAQENDEFAAARDDLWAGTSAEEILASLQQRKDDPDLAPLAEQLAKIDAQGRLPMPPAESEGLAAVALSRTDQATGTAVNALTTLAQAQQKYDEATTEAEKKKAKEDLEKAQDGLKAPLKDAKKLVEDAKTVVNFATFVLSKFEPSAAEAIQEAADTVLPVAEGLIGIGSSIVNGVINFYSGNWIGVIGDAFSALQGLEKLFGGSSASKPKPDPVLVAVENLGKQLEKLGTEMHERFDRVDAALEQIYGALTDGLGEILAKLVANERNVAEIFDRLETQRASLVRLEDRVFALFGAEQRRAQKEAINLAVGKQTMSQDLYDTSTNQFFTWATEHAKDDIALGANRSFAPADLLDELNRGLDTNVDYLRLFTRQVYGLPAPLSNGTVSNPSDWGSAARAFGRVITEHPRHFHSEPRNRARLDGIITAGEHIRDTFAAIAADDAPGPIDTGRPGTGSRVLNAATAYYEDAWAALATAIEQRLATWGADQVTTFDLWKGARQAYNAAHLPNLPAISCGPILSGKTFPAGSPYRTTMPNQLGLAIASGLVSLRVCGTGAEWVNIEDRPETNPRTPVIINRFAQLRVRTEIQVRNSGGTVLATGTGTYLDPGKTLICNFDEDGTDNCDLTASHAVSKADHQWSAISTELGYAWSAAVRAPGESVITEMVRDWLRGRQQVAAGHIVGLLEPGRALSAASVRVSAARKALVSYVELGLPAGLAVDAELRGLLEGGVRPASTSADPLDRVLGGTTRLLDDAGGGHLSLIWDAVAAQYREVDVLQVLRSAGRERILRLEQVLRDHVVPADGQARRRLGQPFIETTLDRLELARSVLTGAGPVTTIRSGPTGHTGVAQPTFTFTTGEEEIGSTVACRLFAEDATPPAYGPCSGATSHSPTTPLGDGAYVFEVRGVDDALVTGAATTRRFVVDTVAAPGDPGGATGPGPSTGPVPTADPGKAASFTMHVKPRVKGKKRVGTKLRVTSGRWAPVPATVSYQWLRNGKKVQGKQGKRAVHRVVRADRGKRLWVRVVVTSPGVTTTRVVTNKVRVRR